MVMQKKGRLRNAGMLTFPWQPKADAPIKNPTPQIQKLSDGSLLINIFLRSPDRAEDRRGRRHTESSTSSNGAASITEDMANIGGPTLLKRTLGFQADRYSQYIGPT